MYSNRKQDSGCLGGGWGGAGGRAQRKFWGMMGMLMILIVVIILLIYKYICQTLSNSVLINLCSISCVNYTLIKLWKQR